MNHNDIDEALKTKAWKSAALSLKADNKTLRETLRSILDWCSPSLGVTIPNTLRESAIDLVNNESIRPST
jgi:hypothetical protein